MKDKEISIPETEECTLAHVDYETQRIQSMQEHAGNVAFFSYLSAPDVGKSYKTGKNAPRRGKTWYGKSG